MSKRRVNKQQAIRIKKIQDNYLQPDQTDDCFDGLVITRFGRHAEIEDNTGKRIHCAIRANIDSLVAGDLVIWQPTEKDQGVVVSRYPRTTVLERPDKYNPVKSVAANISQLLIVVAVKPELSWQLLDSYLVIAENLNIKPIIVLNKVDLPSQPIISTLEKYYAPLNYAILYLSKQNKDAYQALHEVLNNQTNVFVGQSGVGKSSIISEILPNEKEILTAAISTQSELGCHTTSNSRFYHLPSGGALIDSPGVREFGLWKMDKQDILYGFRECRELAKTCKFRNCTHVATPGCSLIEAVDANKISSQRYNNLIYLLSQ